MHGFAQQGETLDAIVYRYFGNMPGMLEQVLLLNPHLLNNAVLSIGQRVELPDNQQKRDVKSTIQLWN